MGCHGMKCALCREPLAVPGSVSFAVTGPALSVVKVNFTSHVVIFAPVLKMFI